MDAASHDPLADLASGDPLAADLLSLLRCFAPDRQIPVEVLEDAGEALPDALGRVFGDPETRRTLFATLESRMLITRDKDSISVHAGPEADVPCREEGRWRAAAAELLRSRFPEDTEDPREWPLCRDLLPHIFALADRSPPAEQYDRSLLWLLDRAATVLCGEARYQEAGETIERALTGAQLQKDDALTGTMLRTRGDLRQALNEPSAARADLERALAIHEQTLDAHDAEVVNDRCALGMVLSELGDLPAARDQLERAVQAGEQEAPANLASAMACRVFGWILLQQREFEPARKENERALVLLEELTDMRHPEAVSARSGLGLVLQAQGDLDGARRELDTALRTSEETLGASHPEVAVLRSNLAGVLQQSGDLDGAREQLELALATGSETLPGNHRGLWIRHSKLASVLRASGDLPAARKHAEQALAIARRGAARNDRRVVINALAQILMGLRDYTMARDRYREARAIAQEDKNTSRGEIGHYDAVIGQLRELGDLVQARIHYAKALEAFTSDYGQDDRRASAMRIDLAGVLGGLARQLTVAWSDLGVADTANAIRELTERALEELFEGDLELYDLELALRIAAACMEHSQALARTAIESAQAKLEETSQIAARRQVGIMWLRLGRALRASADNEGALNALEAALALMPDDPQFKGVTVHVIADLRLAEGKFAEAADLYRQAAESKRGAGEAVSVPDLAITLTALGRTLVRLSDFGAAFVVFEERLELLSSVAELDLAALGVTLRDMGDVRRAEGRLLEAADLYRQAVECKREAGVDSRDLLVTLLLFAESLSGSGDPVGAAVPGGEALQLLRGESDPDPRMLVAALMFATGGALHRDDPGSALPLLEEAHALLESTPEADPAALSGLKLRLAHAIQAKGDDVRVRELREQAAIILRTVFDNGELGENAEVFAGLCALCLESDSIEHASMLVEHARALRAAAPSNHLDRLLAELLRLLGRWYELSAREPQEARAAYEERLRILSGLPDPDPGELGVVLRDLGDVDRLEGRTTEAIEMYRQALRSMSQAESQSSQVSRAGVLLVLGRAFADTGELSAALDAFRERLEVLASLPEPDAHAAGVTLHDMGDVRLAEGKFAEAADLYRQAAESKRGAGEAVSVPDLAITLTALGRTLVRLSDFGAAFVVFEERLELLSSVAELDLAALGVTLRDMGDVRRAEGRLLEAADLYRQAVECKREAGVDSRDLLVTLLLFAESLSGSGDPVGAAVPGGEALQLLRGESDPDPRMLVAALMFATGGALHRDDPGSALPLLEEAHALLESTPEADPAALSGLKLQIEQIRQGTSDADARLQAKRQNSD